MSATVEKGPFGGHVVKIEDGTKTYVILMMSPTKAITIECEYVAATGRNGRLVKRSRLMKPGLTFNKIEALAAEALKAAKALKP